MSKPIRRNIWAGVASERPASGKPGDIWVMLSPTAVPELQFWDDYTVAWIETSALELQYLDGTVAGTSVASRVLQLDANKSIDTLNFDLQGRGTVDLKYEDTTIATADVLTLNATAMPVTSAPGASNYIVFEGAQVWLDYNSTAYDGVAGNEDLQFQYETAATVVANMELTGFIDQTNDEQRWVDPGGAANTVDTGVDGTNVLNKKLMVTITTDEIATGNSPLKLRVFYRIVPKEIA